MGTKRCKKCYKVASFNFKGTTPPIYCFDHKENDMVNVKSRKCLYCNKQPNFNIEGQSASCCFDHKTDDMVNVASKRCLECNKQPIYNIEGEKASYCFDHKTDDMINTKAKKCLYCSKQPSFNIEGEFALYCFDHKTDDMINVRNIECLYCDKQPHFNIEGLPPKYCSQHKDINMIDVTSKKCLECKITRADNPKYKGNCIRCFINLFPDIPVTRDYKIKEKHVFDAVLGLLPKDLNIILDKQVGGCSKRRPDLMIDCGSHWICGENDENCHKDYNTTCENKRTMELYVDMGNRPMILIRFNCDKYSNGESLFKTCKLTGISLIRSKEEFAERIGKFAELINKYILSEPPEKAITTEYLYYDELDSI